MRLTPDKHLHSREHVLADDLSRLMLEPKRFASYLGIAKLYYESELRALAKRVLAKPDLNPKNRGRYFFGALRGLEKRPRRFWKRRKTRRRSPRPQKRKPNVKTNHRNPPRASAP